MYFFLKGTDMIDEQWINQLWKMSRKASVIENLAFTLNISEEKAARLIFHVDVIDLMEKILAEEGE